ncbi:phage tail assembly chaperone G [Paenibacillus senegalimassiliensis]|uniref:phage tail assembly chaperone G n=1 Tax=Paenibacillus senegalimassiliensis TaxID=1737426 RepID=UPI00073E6BED|nr:hypothetical protein [Paenibacillus senegalimassiliensis]
MNLKIKLDKKTYTATSIMSSVSREAMQISRDAIELAKLKDAVTEAAGDEDYDKIAEMMDKLLELKDRKATLVCKAYGNQFDIDTLCNHVSDGDIDLQMNMITSGITNMIAKK